MSVHPIARLGAIFTLGLALCGVTSQAWAAAPVVGVDGKKVYEQRCASCHSGQVARAPKFEYLKARSPESIVDSLENGVMKFIGLAMPDAERKAVAEFVAGKPLSGKDTLKDTASNLCANAPGEFNPSEKDPQWNGWGVTLDNARFQSTAQAGLKPEQIPNLKLKWAFGFEPNSVASQPTVVGGRIFIGTMRGQIYSLDAKTGCVYWANKIRSGMRSAITIARRPNTNPPQYAVYFGDLAANVHAVDARTGKELWTVKVDPHPLARVTGAPKFHDNRLYVPVTSLEEAGGGEPTYECCTFRGNVVALNATTGKQMWKTYTIQQKPKPTWKNAKGVQQYGPAGAGVWASPTLDPERGVMYITTGDDYADPPSNASDAIIELDMKTGNINWITQCLAGDAFNIACTAQDKTNCPKASGPDLDFGSSPILRIMDDGKRIVMAGQKSGVLHAVDPHNNGKFLWQKRVGKGGLIGGIQWGPAADSNQIYVALSDIGVKLVEDPDVGSKSELDSTVGGGMFAYSIANGQKIWETPPPGCGDRKNCSPAQSAAVSVIPGAVFSGSVDGHLRAYGTEDGKIVWDFDASQEFKTVNDVPANGGSFDGAGPTIVGGMLYTSSGYGMWGGQPGNVLLAFSVDGK
ncbi:MAG: PQQ-binding-like beta-propeller repeat protein [Candidatus Binatia bacterium]